MNCGFRISGTALGNRRPPSAELSDCGLKTGLQRDRPACGLRPRTRGPVVQTNPIGRSELCQTNPIYPPAALGPAGPIARNKANFRWDQMRQTNPISSLWAARGKGRQGCQAGAAGPKRAKRTQFRRPGSIPGNSLSGWNGPTWHGRLAHAASAGRRCHGISRLGHLLSVPPIPSVAVTTK